MSWKCRIPHIERIWRDHNVQFKVHDDEYGYGRGHDGHVLYVRAHTIEWKFEGLVGTVLAEEEP